MRKALIQNCGAFLSALGLTSFPLTHCWSVLALVSLEDEMDGVDGMAGKAGMAGLDGVAGMALGGNCLSFQGR